MHLSRMPIPAPRRLPGAPGGRMVAVGTAVAGGPPHRSVREELPHTAPTLSQREIALLEHVVPSGSFATPLSPHDLRSGSVSGARRACSAFLSAESLPSADSADASAAPLFADFAGTTDSSDFLPAFMSALPPVAFADRSTDHSRCPAGHWSWKQTGSPGSRAWSFQACPGSSTPPCRRDARHIAVDGVAFPQTPQGRHTEWVISELNGWPACTSCRCYTHGVTAVSVRFKAGVTG